MKLAIQRNEFLPDRTFGKLYINGNFTCYTLEDTVRHPFVKVDGQTAIPAGNYRIAMSNSPKFGALMPEILNVPQFSGIRIHSGNTEADTEGCVLVGMDKPEKSGLEISKTWLAYGVVVMQIYHAYRQGEDITIEITETIDQPTEE